jgi:acetyl-CoA carboxylase biotin carboxylase subunit
LDYDPMLSKLIAFAGTREAAIARMLGALTEYQISGIETNLSRFRRILNDPGFRAAAIDTGYLERMLAEPEASTAAAVPAEIAAIAAAFFAGQAVAPEGAGVEPVSLWLESARREGLRA